VRDPHFARESLEALALIAIADDPEMGVRDPGQRSHGDIETLLPAQAADRNEDGLGTAGPRPGAEEIDIDPIRNDVAPLCAHDV
jgi:hypothetical protein